LKLSHDKIQKLMADGAMTLYALSARCGRSQPWAGYLLRRIEAGESIKPKAAGVLARGLGVTVDAIAQP